MPKKYMALKKRFMQDGLSEKAAETKAARIYNANRREGDAPVDYDREKRKHRDYRG